MCRLLDPCQQMPKPRPQHLGAAGLLWDVVQLQTIPSVSLDWRALQRPSAPLPLRQHPDALCSPPSVTAEPAGLDPRMKRLLSGAERSLAEAQKLLADPVFTPVRSGEARP